MTRPSQRNLNLSAYEGAESLSNFGTREEIDAYRNSRLLKYRSATDFLIKRSAHLPVSVFEVGSGSSALLYVLARGKVLKSGVGIELSRSRFEFAELWKSDDGYEAVTNYNRNFAAVELQRAAFDWCIVIDNTFTYLHPEDPEYPRQLLRQAFSALNEGGRVLLDFINYARRTPGTDYRDWTAFAALDPFSYGLYSHRIDSGVNCSESIFIKREGGESRKKELSKVYALEELGHLLGECGFEIKEAFASFDEAPYVASSSDRLVVVAAKARQASRQDRHGA